MLLLPEVFALNSGGGVAWGGGLQEVRVSENFHSPVTCTPIRGFKHDRLGKEGIWGVGRLFFNTPSIIAS